MPNLKSSKRTQHQLSVFLDSNVITQFQRGRLTKLFEPEALSRFHYVINPLILQEVIFADARETVTASLDQVTKHTEIVPVDIEKTGALIQRARESRDKIVHSNDLLSLGSASDCDYFVTDDRDLQKDWNSKKPKILSTAEFERMLDSA